MDWRVLLRAGLLAGILDILAAFIVYGFRGASPIGILQSIASGLLGADAFRGGLRTAALGLVLHFFIACVAAFVYYASSRRLAILRRRPVISGLAYGTAVYLFMSFVVVPLSAVASGAVRSRGRGHHPLRAYGLRGPSDRAHRAPLRGARRPAQSPNQVASRSAPVLLRFSRRPGFPSGGHEEKEGNDRGSPVTCLESCPGARL
ncbi:MAG: hypothetical protein ACRD21_01145 [Vicinamibacteria bacterium]